MTHTAFVKPPFWRALLHVLIAASVAVGTFVLHQPTARADEDSCLETIQLLANWGRREAARGVTSKMLGELHRMMEEIDQCYAQRPGPTDGTDTAAGVEFQGMGADATRWRPLVAAYFDSADVDRALCLMSRESGGNPNAVNQSSGAAGLMQVMPFWATSYGYTVEDLLKPNVNLWVAGQIRKKQGWVAWSPYLRGACH